MNTNVSILVFDGKHATREQPEGKRRAELRRQACMLTPRMAVASPLAVVESCKAHPHQQCSRHKHKHPAA